MSGGCGKVSQLCQIMTIVVVVVVKFEWKIMVLVFVEI